MFHDGSLLPGEVAGGCVVVCGLAEVVLTGGRWVGGASSATWLVLTTATVVVVVVVTRGPVLTVLASSW